jgi:hypothetical protein
VLGGGPGYGVAARQPSSRGCSLHWFCGSLCKAVAAGLKMNPKLCDFVDGGDEHTRGRRRDWRFERRQHTLAVGLAERNEPHTGRNQVGHDAVDESVRFAAIVCAAKQVVSAYSVTRRDIKPLKIRQDMRWHLAIGFIFFQLISI